MNQREFTLLANGGTAVGGAWRRASRNFGPRPEAAFRFDRPNDRIRLDQCLEYESRYQPLAGAGERQPSQTFVRI